MTFQKFFKTIPECIFRLFEKYLSLINNRTVCSETNDCLKHLIRILKQKQDLFKESSSMRRNPFELDSQTITLNDFIKWLVQWILKPNTEARHKALEIIYHLSPNVKESVSNKVNDILKHIDVVSSQNSIKNHNSVYDLEEVLACVEVGLWLVDQKIVSENDVNLNVQPLIDKLMKNTSKEENSAEYQEQVCIFISRYLDWLVIKFQKTPNDYNLIKSAIIYPSKIGFDVRNHIGLRTSIKKLVVKLPPSFKLPLFERTFQKTINDFLSGTANNDPLLFQETLEGLVYLKGFIPNAPKITIDEEKLGKILILRQSDTSWIDVCNSLLEILLSIIPTEKILKMIEDFPMLLKGYEDVFFRQFAVCNEIDLLLQKIGLPMLVRLVKYCATTLKKPQENSGVILTEYIISHWTEIVDLSQPGTKLLTHLCRYLAMLNPTLLAASTSIQEWFYQILDSRELPIKMKNYLLQLLHHFTNMPLQDVLERMTHSHFPIKTEENIKKGTMEYAECLTTYKKIANAMEVSGSKCIFLFLIKSTCQENNHIANDIIMETLLKTPEKLALLQEGFDTIVSRGFPPLVQWRICRNFLSIILKVMIYFLENITIIAL